VPVRLTRQTAPNGAVVYLSPQLAAAGVPHAFSTRRGGVSGPPFDTLNLGNPSGCDRCDPPANLAENHARLMAAAGLTAARRRWTTQVHGCGVALVDAGFTDGCPADALVTAEPGQALSVRSADCCPVLLSTADGRAVAAAHAGWRGAVAGVAAAAAAELCRVAGVAPDMLLGAVGPCIACDAFEVGPEVLAAFADRFGADAVRRDGPDGKGHADLPEAIRRSLLSAGLSPDRIDTTDRCSHRDADEFFSHRRDRGVTGRMAAVIAARADAPRGHGDTEDARGRR
jgi:YfiH family protein